MQTRTEPMSVKYCDTHEVQDLLRNVAGLDQAGGDPRTKQIMHRVLSDLFRAIDDLDIIPDDYWTAVGWFTELGTAGQAGLISPGLGARTGVEEGKSMSVGVHPGCRRYFYKKKKQK